MLLILVLVQKIMISGRISFTFSSLLVALRAIFIIFWFFDMSCRRYSIWVDAKLRLESDPLLLLERFLWRKGYEFAISDHYARHCVWEEVARNKVLKKVSDAELDRQLHFYEADGLTRFNASVPRNLLPSSMCSLCNFLFIF